MQAKFAGSPPYCYFARTKNPIMALKVAKTAAIQTCRASQALHSSCRSSEPLIPGPSLGPVLHDLLRLLVVNFCERVVCLTVGVQ